MVCVGGVYPNSLRNNLTPFFSPAVVNASPEPELCALQSIASDAAYKKSNLRFFAFASGRKDNLGCLLGFGVRREECFLMCSNIVDVDPVNT